LGKFAIRAKHFPSRVAGEVATKEIVKTRNTNMIIKLERIILLLGMFVLAGCSQSAPVLESIEPTAVPELIVYDWPGGTLSVVVDAFTAETGIPVTYVNYISQEEAADSLRAGGKYDVVVFDNEFIRNLVAEELLAEINLQNVPNFRFISPNFRDLIHDPGNKYTIPFTWGTTGLVVRDDLIAEPVTSWQDLWDDRYSGRVVGWYSVPRAMLGAALMSLGYSINSEDPAELEAALAKLLKLQPNAIWLDDHESSAEYLVSGQGVMALGWAYDVQLAREEIETISYILPEEGSILWADSLVIPASSTNGEAAERFLNFVLRPEIGAQIVNATYYPMASEAVNEYVDPELLQNPVIFPPAEALHNAELVLPLSPAGEQLYADIWARLLAASGQ
jgi:spermidine/putrescine transport system substrate-binding protein